MAHTTNACADAASYTRASSLENSHGQLLTARFPTVSLTYAILCVTVGAKWGVRDTDGNYTFPCDKGACLDMSAVAGSDAVLKEVMQVGLGFEVLSSKIYTEEPTACLLISDALINAQKSH